MTFGASAQMKHNPLPRIRWLREPKPVEPVFKSHTTHLDITSGSPGPSCSGFLRLPTFTFRLLFVTAFPACICMEVPLTTEDVGMRKKPTNKQTNQLCLFDPSNTSTISQPTHQQTTKQASKPASEQTNKTKQTTKQRPCDP